MKKIFLILLIIISLGLIVFFYFKYGDNTKQVSTPVLKETNVVENNLTQEKKIGEMVLKYITGVKVSREEYDFLNLEIESNFRKFSRDQGYKEIVVNSAPLIFSISQNINPEKKPVDKWFEENNPEEEKQSVYSTLTEEEIKIGGISARKVRYLANVQLTGGFYDLITLYVPRNTDIYEISYYAVPINEVDSNFQLDKSDLNNAEQYTKIVEQIIKSIYFVD